MAMSATTANWHWKSKGVTAWARTWFENELPTVIFTTEDVTIGVSNVSDMEGAPSTILTCTMLEC